jgi:RNA polymerase I-specific transcription initiation factor RRN6
MQRDDLQYGSFGHATYDVDRSNWQFRRSTQKSLSLRQLGQPQIIVDKSSCTDDERFSDGAKAVRHSRQIKTLVKMHPEVHPAADVLPALARVSEAVIEATRRHDPTKGNLLAVGKITDQGVQRTAEIAAFPDGPTGSDVRIMQLQSQRQGWSDTRRAWLEVPIFSGEEATWKGLGAPIQSLTFSRPINHGHGYLVARLPTKLVFFRPVLRPAAVRSATRLDVNAVAELQIAATGHSPHADVAFDPWHTRHFAVVDDIGNLSLWKLGRNETGKVAQICSGSLNEASENRPVHLFRDGWARIAWTYDYTMIAVCNRHLLRLFDISDQSFVERVSINSDFDGFILDMISVRSGLDHLCVLTSTYIVMFRQHRDIENEPVMDRVAQIRHHMNPDDISLRLRTFEGDKGTTSGMRFEMSKLINDRSRNPHTIRSLWPLCQHHVTLHR